MMHTFMKWFIPNINVLYIDTEKLPNSIAIIAPHVNSIAKEREQTPSVHPSLCKTNLIDDFESADASRQRILSLFLYSHQ